MDDAELLVDEEAGSDEEPSWDELLIEDEDEEAMYCSEQVQRFWQF